MNEARIEAAYRHCEALASRHYENFPVASRLLPRPLRRPVAVVYAFARRADDVADEGDLTVSARLERLDRERRRLLALGGDGPPPDDDPILAALGDVVRRHRLPLDPFLDLLSAFRQDVEKRRYADFDEILDYCRRSANPVGRLVLLLTGHREPSLLPIADALCTALQLINFYQDIGQDLDENDRLYLPLDEMAAHGVTIEDLRRRRSDGPVRDLLARQYARCRRILDRGMPIGWRIPGRIGLELRLTALGGRLILDRLEKGLENPYRRPRLTPSDWPALSLRALLTPASRIPGRGT